MTQQAWESFTGEAWKKSVDVREFIQNNYTPYEGDDSFLVKEATSATTKLWDNVMEGIKKENATKAPLDFDSETPSTIVSHKPGYIEKDIEQIVGLQTDAPLKRAIMPHGGLRMVQTACDVYGKTLSPQVIEIYSKYKKSHNAGVFDVYTPEIRACRKSGIITGLPDAYGRGRIIGDYRRVALYGIDFLMADKKSQHDSLNDVEYDVDVIRLREEIQDQYRALADIKVMADSYGFDISKPAINAKEAIQWTYFGYLAAVKSQNGAAMSLGRTSTFIDIYLERDIKNGTIDEVKAQELVDHFIMKLRMVRFLRTPEYDQLFSGDPIWATESLAGMGLDGRTLVTKTSFRYLNTMYTMGPSPEPNMTILWSEQLPQGFKEFTSQVSIDTSSVQYENDDLMRADVGQGTPSDDYAIACCVSPMVVGKQMQFFGARANLAKTLLYTINGGVDEKLKIQVGPKADPILDEVLNYNDVFGKLDKFMDWLANQYVKALNCIHYMHDKYAYEAALMAFHDRDVFRTMACGIAGISVAADSLSAIKYAKVKPIRDENGIAIDFNIEGDFPKFGNDDDKVDSIAVDLVERFMKKIRTHKMYRNAKPTQSLLTITSNVVYGKKTGNTPDGRLGGKPFGPGANPMHGRDTNGAVASLNSVAKLPFKDAQDGISYTFSIVPNALGKERGDQKTNLAGLMDGYFHHEEKSGKVIREGGQHLNVNVLNRETLQDAVKHPENYPQLTIRVSGYAVRFNSLTPEQQQDVITRTFTATM